MSFSLCLSLFLTQNLFMQLTNFDENLSDILGNLYPTKSNTNLARAVNFKVEAVYAQCVALS
jgi:hypothetical protein